jgi:uncharacterized membrane protein
MFMCLAGAALAGVTQLIAGVKRLPLVAVQVVQLFVDIQFKIMASLLPVLVSARAVRVFLILLAAATRSQVEMVAVQRLTPMGLVSLYLRMAAQEDLLEGKQQLSEMHLLTPTLALGVLVLDHTAAPLLGGKVITLVVMAPVCLKAVTIQVQQAVALPT